MHLVHLDAARRELALASSVDSVREIRDKAEAIRAYFRQRDGGLDAALMASELKLRAERRLGDLLAETVGGSGTYKQNSHRASFGRLPEGVSYSQSSRWQAIASIPEGDFEHHVAQQKRRRVELTTSGALKLARIHSARKPVAAQERGETCRTTDLEALISTGMRFGTIYADPPWRYGNQSTRAATGNHYDGMSVEEIAALPVAKLAAENSHLHLWTTNAFLFESREILEAWGFTYKSVLVWVKPEMGIGNYWRVSHEFMLLGLRGDCPFLDRGQKSWIQCERGRHSQKPKAVRDAIEKVSPGPRLEMFARHVSPGWVAWGNEIDRDLFAQTAREVAV